METVIQKLRARNLQIVTVESCTGGALASAITDIPGASDVFQQGFVTYSNRSKLDFGIHLHILEAFSVYSPEMAKEMALVGLKRAVKKDFEGTIVVATTGSLNRQDPHNPKASIPGLVFAHVLWQISDGLQQHRPLTVSVDNSLSRAAAKQYVVLEIKSELLKILNDH